MSVILIFSLLISVRGCIIVSDTSEFFLPAGAQHVSPASADDPATAAADFRNFLRVVYTILFSGYVKKLQMNIFFKKLIYDDYL
jgi:hypothetical protein